MQEIADPLNQQSGRVRVVDTGSASLCSEAIYRYLVPNRRFSGTSAGRLPQAGYPRPDACPKPDARYSGFAYQDLRFVPGFRRYNNGNPEQSEDPPGIWGNLDLPRYLHHPMFFLEFGDTAFVARDLDTGEIAGYLLGFVAPIGDGYIHLVAVRDDSRTLGLGRRMYEAFEKAARERGAVALKAITGPGNESSVAFHKRVGFAEMIRVEDYGGSGWARIVMRKPLS